MLRIKKTKRPDTHIMTRFKQLLRRFPFTLLMLVVLGATAVSTNTHLSTLTKGWLSRLGYAPRDLWLFNWERLITSALVTFGQSVFWQAMGMIALAVGAAEWLAGTKRTAVTFWGVHLTTLLSESLLIALPLHLSGSTTGTALILARDVGPSAGYFGCLGLASRRLPQPWSWLSGTAVLMALIVALFQAPRVGQETAVKLAADLAHLIAFPLGWLTGGWHPKQIPHHAAA
jgi:hypothetical protein